MLPPRCPLVVLLLWLASAAVVVASWQPTITVKRGRQVALHPRELLLAAGPSSDCRVQLIDEPGTQLTGTLQPQIFDCYFEPYSLTFSHHGNSLLQLDLVHVWVHHLSPEGTRSTRHSIHVRVLLLPYQVFVQSPDMDKLTVDELSTQSSDLSAGSLRFKYDLARGARCTLRYSPGIWPRSGHLVSRNGIVVNSFTSDCREALYRGFRYVLTDGARRIDRDFLPFSLTLNDPVLNDRPIVEYLQLEVRIAGAKANKAPQLAASQNYVFETEQFVSKILDPAMIRFTDVETSPSEVLFNVTSLPVSAQVMLVSSQNRPVTTFFGRDLFTRKILFSSGLVTSQDPPFSLRAVDVFGNSSDEVSVPVYVRPSMSRAPRVRRNLGIVLLEGGSHSINASHFDVVDSDDEENVRFYARGGLRHGRLRINGRDGLSFTLKELRSGAVVYHHDDSDAPTDRISFRISDNRHTVRSKFHIIVLPKDDSAPYLTRKLDIDVFELGITQLNTSILKAYDRDTDESKVRFIVRTPPSAGILQRTALKDERSISVFTQEELENGFIYYRHKVAGSQQDMFDIRLMDQQDPPNKSGRYSVLVVVTPNIGFPPQINGNTSRQMDVDEDGVAIISQGTLLYEASGQVSYSVRQMPFFLSTTETFDGGKLVILERRGNWSTAEARSLPPAFEFTQSQVNAGRIAYVTPEQIRSEQVRFIFVATGQNTASTTDQYFDIRIRRTKHLKPRIRAKKLQVASGGTLWLTLEDIDVEDADTRPEQLNLHLLQQPKHGGLFRGHMQLNSGSKFSVIDLKMPDIRYVHDGQSMNDDFEISVSDGDNVIHQHVNIEARILARDQPVAKISSGPIALHRIARPPEGTSNKLIHEDVGVVVREKESAIINQSLLNLAASPEQLSAMKLTLIQSPSHGKIMLDGEETDEVRLEELLAGRLRYRHNGKEVGLEPLKDTMSWALLQHGKLRATRSRYLHEINVTVTPVDNVSPELTFGEPLFAKHGQTITLTPNMLNALDVDTPPHKLRFVVAHPLREGSLQVTSKFATTNQATEFSLQDLREGHVHYIPFSSNSIHKLSFYVTDGHRNSPVSVLHIGYLSEVVPDLAQRYYQVDKGKSCRINVAADLSSINFARDKSEEVRISVIEKPKSGKLYLVTAQFGDSKQMKMEIFTQFSLKGVLDTSIYLSYEHDNSPSSNDFFFIGFSDGRRLVRQKFSITVISSWPVTGSNNSEVPEVTIGQNLAFKEKFKISVARAGHVTLKALPHVLRGQTMSLLSEPGDGAVERQDADSIAWKLVDEGATISEEDLHAGRVRYRDRNLLSDKDIDSFVFRTSSGNDLVVEVHIAPFVSSATTESELRVISKGSHIAESGSIVLHQGILGVENLKISPAEVTFKITTAPSHGHIAFVSEKHLSILSFAFSDIESQKIVYVHTDKSDIASDTFAFAVMVPGQELRGVFDVDIEVREKELPTLVTAVSATVMQGASVTLGNEHLYAFDPDTAPSGITYMISEPPQYGTFRLKGVPIENQFTQHDVNMDYVSYQSNGSGHSGIDYFVFTINDGVHLGFLINGSLQSSPVFFTVLIQPITEVPPVLKRNATPQELITLGDGRHGFMLSRQHLVSTHPSSEATELVYSLTKRPTSGVIERISHSGMHRSPTVKFSQEEIDRGLIVFVIKDNIDESNDTVEFSIADSFGNLLKDQSLFLEWSVFEFEAADYEVCENVGTLAIHVRRLGSLKVHAQVSVLSKMLTALEHLDYEDGGSGRLDFQTGEMLKKWSIRIKNDAIDEGTEKLRLQLRNPLNAILGPKQRATVHIDNYRNGRCERPSGMDESSQKKAAIFVPETPSELLLRDKTQVSGVSEKPYSPLEEYIMNKKRIKEKEKKKKKKRKKRKKKRPPVTYALRRHPLDQSLLQKDTELPSRPCNTVLRGLLYFDMPTSSMFTCDGVEWMPWVRDMSRMQHTAPQLTVETARDRRIPMTCEAGWHKFSGSCYKAFQDRDNWNNGNARCVADGAQLTHIESAKHLSWLWRLAGNSPFWTGLNDKRMHHVWEYANGEPVRFYHWRRRFPKSQKSLGKNCVLVSSGAEWVNRPCNRNQNRFICVKPSPLGRNSWSESKRRRRHW